MTGEMITFIFLWVSGIAALTLFAVRRDHKRLTRHSEIKKEMTSAERLARFRQRVDKARVKK